MNKILIGNKCELDTERVVTHAEGEALARKYRMPFFECSAKKDINVDAVRCGCVVVGGAAALWLTDGLLRPSGIQGVGDAGGAEGSPGRWPTDGARR